MTADKNFKRRVRERVARTGESYVAARRQLLRRREESLMAPVLVPVRLVGVSRGTLDEKTYARLHLREVGGPKEVQLFVGLAEGSAVVLGAAKATLPRPMTHDMLRDTVAALGATPQRAVISLIPETGVFTALLTLRRGDGSTVELDCRPSDVIALAVRYDDWPEILVPRDVLDVPDVPFEQAEPLQLGLHESPEEPR